MTRRASAITEHLGDKLGYQHTGHSFGSITAMRDWRCCAYHVFALEDYRAKQSKWVKAPHYALDGTYTPSSPHALRPGRAFKLESIDER